MYFKSLGSKEGRSDICAKVIDDDLPFLASVTLFFDALICEPFIDEACKGIDTAEANGRILVS